MLFLFSFYNEDGGSRFLQNVAIHLLKYTDQDPDDAIQNLIAVKASNLVRREAAKHHCATYTLVLLR